MIEAAAHQGHDHVNLPPGPPGWQHRCETQVKVAGVRSDALHTTEQKAGMHGNWEGNPVSHIDCDKVVRTAHKGEKG